MCLEVSEYMQMREKSPCFPFFSGVDDKPEDAEGRVTGAC